MASNKKDLATLSELIKSGDCAKVEEFLESNKQLLAHLVVKTLFSEKQEEYSPLHEAAQFKQPRVLELLISKFKLPVSCELKDFTGTYPPLVMSVHENTDGHAECAKILLKHGADSDKQWIKPDGSGVTALEKAKSRKMYKLVEVLAMATSKTSDHEKERKKLVQQASATEQGLKYKLKGKEIKIKKLQKDKEDLEEKIASCNVNIEKLESDKKALADEIIELKTKLGNQQRLSDVAAKSKRDLDQLTGDLKKISKVKEDLEKECKRLQDELESKENDLGQVSIERSELQTRIKGLEEHLDNANNAKEDLEQQLGEKEEKLKGFDTKAEEYQFDNPLVEIIDLIGAEKGSQQMKFQTDIDRIQRLYPICKKVCRPRKSQDLKKHIKTMVKTLNDPKKSFDGLLLFIMGKYLWYI